MDGPPFCLAFVMVKESFVVPTIFFYLERAPLTKDKGVGDHLKPQLLWLSLSEWDLYFFARGQICPPRADLPAPFWRDHFFIINQRLMEMETCFPETRFRFRHSLKWNCNVDGLETELLEP
jgi:hypothetical protein